MMKKRPQVDDADVDRFLALVGKSFNPALSAEQLADSIHDFVLAYAQLTEYETSMAWAKEMARKVRQRALWLKR